MPFDISRSDMITFFNKDAIVIPSHTDLKKCPGISEEIFNEAGSIKLSMACRKGKNLKSGEAFVTDGYKSKYKYIIHVACLPAAGEKSISDDILYKCGKSTWAGMNAIDAIEEWNAGAIGCELKPEKVGQEVRYWWDDSYHRE